MNILAPTNTFWVVALTIAKFVFTQSAQGLMRVDYAITSLKLCCAIWGAACISNTFLIIEAPQFSSILGALGFICIVIYLSGTHWDFEPNHSSQPEK
jgi:hypothetical protein